MTINEYQQLAARTINHELTDLDMELHALHLIASECGEIHGMYQKCYQGHRIDEEALVYEVGDLLWGIAELCTVNGWSMEVVAERNIAKLRRRYPEGFDAERSRNREEEQAWHD